MPRGNWKKSGGGRGGGRGGRGEKRGRGPASGDGTKLTALGDPRGFPGVLVMCDDKREKRAMHETCDLLNAELDERMPPRPSSSASAAADADADADGHAHGDGGDSLGGPAGKKPRTIADELADELAELEGGAPPPPTEQGGADGGAADGTGAPRQSLAERFAGKRARFLDLSGRAFGLVWVKDASVDPVALVDPLLEAALRTKASPLRFTSRLLPLQRIVQASPSAIIEAAVELMRSTVPAPRATSFRLELRVRLNTTFSKDALYRDLVPALCAANATAAAAGTAGAGASAAGASSSSSSSSAAPAPCPRHTVHLTDPETVVMVEVIKTFAGVSILSDRRWDRLARYNIRLAAETEEDRLGRLARQAVADEAGRKRREEAAASAAERAAAEAAAGPAAASSSAAPVPTAAKTTVWFAGGGGEEDEEGDDIGDGEEEQDEGEEEEEEETVVGSSAAAPAPAPSIVSRDPETVLAGGGRTGRYVVRGLPPRGAASEGGHEKEEEEEAVLEYTMEPVRGGSGVGSFILDITHTFVPSWARGRGVAADLTREALRDAAARSDGLVVSAVRPSCSYVAETFVPRHAEELGWTTKSGGEGGGLLTRKG
jgi:predicted GNAT family acetyltransferase/tRNA(Ser,Leu) C12 N-acetylase TAN1